MSIRKHNLGLAIFALVVISPISQAQEADDDSAACRILGNTVGVSIVWAGTQNPVTAANAIKLIALASGADELTTYTCNNAQRAAEAALTAYYQELFSQLGVTPGNPQWRPNIPISSCKQVYNCQPIPPPDATAAQRLYVLDTWGAMASVVDSLDGGRAFSVNTLSFDIVNSYNSYVDGSLHQYESMFSNTGVY